MSTLQITHIKKYCKNILIATLSLYILLAGFSCASDEVVFVADPVFTNLFLSDRQVKKEIRAIAGSYTYSLKFLEYDLLTNSGEGTADKTAFELKKALIQGSKIILSPMLSLLVAADDTEEDILADAVITVLKELSVNQLVYWVSQADALSDNYYRIVRSGSQGWYDAGLFGGTYNSGSTFFIYIENDEKGESHALSFLQGAIDSGASPTEVITMSKNTSIKEMRQILDSMGVSNTDNSVLGVYAGIKTEDIIKLARELGLFVVCEQAEWLIDNNNESFGTIKENLPIVFERVFRKLNEISIPEYNESFAVTENDMIIPSQMEFVVIDD